MLSRVVSRAVAMSPSASCFASPLRVLSSIASPKPSKSTISTTTSTSTMSSTPLSSSSSSTSTGNVSDLDDAAVLELISNGKLSIHTLETSLNDCTRAVHLRRQYYAKEMEQEPSNPVTSGSETFSGLPVSTIHDDVFYKSVLGSNCEAVIGFMPIPVGMIGPLLVDGVAHRVPLATTEGALLASTNRGARAITRSGGATTAVTANGMTRAPVIELESLAEAAKLQEWVKENFSAIEEAFNSTSRYARLVSIKCTGAGRKVYLRFRCTTGDAMGMNMISKGVNKALNVLHDEFPTLNLLSLSGNFCSDKKASSINWIEGRGKSVIAEAVIPESVVNTTLKTTVDELVHLNISKNLVGSAMAGSIGGFNAHASNIVSAFFLATGQDPAQNVESSSCLTQLEKCSSTGSLVASVTMPSIEVGTVGGGTSLPAQAACLDMLGVRGSHATEPGKNAETLARLVASSVLCGELSLMAALCSGDLINSHLRLNRKEEKAAAAAASEGTAAASSTTTTSAAAGKPAAASPGARFFSNMSTPTSTGSHPRLSSIP